MKWVLYTNLMAMDEIDKQIKKDQSPRINFPHKQNGSIGQWAAQAHNPNKTSTVASTLLQTLASLFFYSFSRPREP